MSNFSNKLKNSLVKASGGTVYYDTSFSKETTNLKESTNSKALIFKIIAILIFVVAFFAGISLAYTTKTTFDTDYFGKVTSNTKETFSAVIMFVYWIAGFISGMLFLGISWILEEIQNIKNI